MEASYLPGVIKQFSYYRSLGEKAIAQLPPEALNYRFNEESNSITTIIKHLSGNMLSRFTDFTASDGEKPWRNRDNEFEHELLSHEEIMHRWNIGWECLMSALASLSETDLESIVYIRNDGHTVMEAINRQLAHYPYHVGQIVYLARMYADGKWQSLSIARNASTDYNEKKFSADKQRRHFTEGLL